MAKAVPERERLVKNLNSEEKRQQSKLNDLLDEHFSSASAGKLVDKVLQSEMVEPRLQQLRGNIAKLDSQISWHRSKLGAFSREEGQLNKEADDLTAYDLLQECHQAYGGWSAVYLDAERRFEKFKDAIRKARQYDRNFLNRLPALEIKDEAFVTIVDSKLKDEYIAEVSQDSVVRDLALDYRTKQNLFYQDPNISVSRERSSPLMKR